MKIDLIVCDACGAHKGETNHWWQAYVHEGSFHFAALVESLPTLKDVCGQNCASKLLERFMSTGSLEDPAKGGTKND